MAGDIKLKIGADTSEIEKAFGALIKKVQSDADKLKIGSGKPTAAAKETPVAGLREYQQAHAKVQQSRNDKIAAEASNRLLDKKENLLAKIVKQESELVKSGKDASFWANARLKTEKDINEEKKAGAILNEKAKKEEVRSYKELLSHMEKAYKMGGVGGLKTALSGMSGMEKMAFGATAAGGALGIAGAVANYIGQRPIDIARMQASAISMTTGRQLGEARSGEYTYEGMYGTDRKKAQEQADTSNKWKTAGDIALAGAAAAALIGSAFVTGGASLALAGAGGVGLASSLFGEKSMADLSKYSAYREQRTAQDFTTMLAAEHEMGPYRKDAIERFKATGARDLDMQRTLGLKDSGYYGQTGYLQSQMGLDFTDDMVTRSSKGILGAGGSTAMGLQSGTALQAERGLGLTNADQLLGQLSGSQSIPETSKKALIDIFARGFDASKYAEENRKYMQAVTEQVYKGGSVSVDATDKIADMIRSTITGAPTTRNIEAGKTAFEAFQTASTATSGYLGGINIASAMQDKDLRKIKDPAELKELLSLKYNEIDEADQDLIDSANKMGITGADLAKKLRGRQLGNMRTSMAGRTSGMAQRGMIDTVIPGMDAPARKAFANLINQEESPERNAAISQAFTTAERDMAGRGTGKAGDTAVQASSENAKISLETLSASINQFATDAINAAKKLAGEAVAGRAAEAAAAKDKAEGADTSGGRFSHGYKAPRQGQAN